MQKSWVGDIPNTHVRDYQRKRLYQAEDSCMFWGNTKVLTYEQTVNLISRVSSWAKIEPPNIIEDGHYPMYATPEKISFSYPSLKILPYIIHEMAHVINYNSENPDHHGKHFCGIYLELVKHFISEGSYKDLIKAFKRYKVEYSWFTQIDH